MYENMLTIEDINTVLTLYPHFNQLYKINTGLLPTNSFNEKYYDFNIISMTKNGTDYTYRVEVYNKLWTGGISYGRLTNPPTINTITDKVNPNGEVYIIEITADTNDFDIYLNLDNDYEGDREVYHSELRFDPVVEDLEYYYYESKSLDLRVVNIGGVGVSGVSVKLYQDNSLLVQGNTNSSGEVVLNIPHLPPNTYVLHLVAEKTGTHTHTQYFTAKVKKETPAISCTPTTTYKGGYGSTDIKVTLAGTDTLKPTVRVECKDNKYGSDITLPLTKKSSTTYTAKYEENLRKYRGDQIGLKITLEETDYTAQTTYTYIKSTPTYIANNWSSLKDEIENSYGVDLIGLPQGEITAGSTISVDRDIELVGETGIAWPVLKEGSDYLFRIEGRVNDWVQFYTRNIAYRDNTNGVLFADEYTYLLVDNCYFLGNKKKDNIGVCIKNPIDTVYQDDNYFTTRITRSTFENNKGGAVSMSGNTEFEDNIIIVNSWDYCQHPQPFAYHQYSQIGVVNKNEIVMDLNGEGRSPLPRYIHSNFSWGSKPLLIHRNAYFNGKKGKDMIGSESLNYNDNTGYIYALYEYSDDLSYWYNVSASPRLNRERSCFGHIITGEEYSWHDGLQIKTGVGNTSRKPTYYPPVNNRDGRGHIE